MGELLGVVGLALAVSGLCSILEAVLLSVPASHVALLRRRSPAGRRLWEMRRDLDEPVAAILTLNTISHTVGAAVAGAMALELFGSEWMAAFSAVLTVAILLLSEILPKTLGARYSRGLALPAARVLVVLRWLLRPVLVPLAAFNRLLSGTGNGAPTVSRAELEVLAEVGRSEGTLDDDEWRILTRAMRLHRLRVEQVMVPRSRMVGLSADATAGEARAEILREGHSRVPVYGEGPDDVVGVLWAGALADAPDEVRINELARPALFVPSGLRVDAAIARLRETRQKIAMVVDEFGGSAGLVTMEDLVEEIVGDIAAEGDGPPRIERLDEGRVVLDGGTPLREVEYELGVRLEDGAHDTVGGYLLHRLGRVPRPGDAVRVDAHELVVVETEDRRVARVELTGVGS